jgi:hypothetical protein
VQQPAHGLKLQAGLAAQPLTGPRRHLTPEALELRERLFLLADVGQALAHLPEAGGASSSVSVLTHECLAFFRCAVL